MSEFYHDSLVGLTSASLSYFNLVKENMNQFGLSLSPQWKSVGEAVSVTLMWGDVPGFVYLPYALQHPRLTLGLSNLLQDNLYAKFGGKSEVLKEYATVCRRHWTLVSEIKMFAFQTDTLPLCSRRYTFWWRTWTCT